MRFSLAAPARAIKPCSAWGRHRCSFAGRPEAVPGTSDGLIRGDIGSREGVIRTGLPHLDRRAFVLAALAALSARPALAQPAQAEPRRIRVLIIDGVSNHDWRLTTRILRAILEPTGLFEVSVSTSPPTAQAPGWDDWRPDFAQCDVVLQTYNDIWGGPAWRCP